MGTTKLISSYNYYDNKGDMFKVHPERVEEAAKIDANHDHILQDDEIMDYLVKHDALEDPTYEVVDRAKVVAEFKAHLAKKIPQEAAYYHTYEQVGEELQRLAQERPDLAKLVSLGHTYEGREIWALKISKNAQSDETKHKPGIVFTGCHHAREWMSMEAPLYLAQQLVENYDTDEKVRQRVDNAEIWVIPLVNPDGYEYSRTEDNWWRKNRRPVDNIICGPRGRHGIGVDLNRNYDDGVPGHHSLYRPPGDTPCSTADDFGGATSDDPNNNTYRGPYGSSEEEVRDLLELELHRGNVKGVIDHHGYGQMILYPWGNTREPVDNVSEYREIGSKMNEALGDVRYRLMQSIDLYPTSGVSQDIHQANGLISITLEMGTSFQPDVSQIGPIRERIARADMTFIDEILKRSSGEDKGGNVA